jgi:predicted PurR-regulated permease PerM
MARRLQARLNRTLAITAVTLGIIALGAVLLMLTIPPLVRQGQKLLAHLPEYTRAVEQSFHRCEDATPSRPSRLPSCWTSVPSAGKRTVNVLPWPTWLSASTVPPCASTTQ